MVGEPLPRSTERSVMEVLLAFFHQLSPMARLLLYLEKMINLHVYIASWCGPPHWDQGVEK